MEAVRYELYALHQLHGFFSVVHGAQLLSVILAILYPRFPPVSIRISHGFVLLFMELSRISFSPDLCYNKNVAVSKDAAFSFSKIRAFLFPHRHFRDIMGKERRNMAAPDC